MKIRKYLVSNSSSSSWIAFVKKDIFDEYRAKESPAVQRFLSTIAGEDIVLSLPVMVIEEFLAHGYSTWDDLPFDHDEIESPSETWWDFLHKIPKADKWSRSIDT